MLRNYGLVLLLVGCTRDCPTPTPTPIVERAAVIPATAAAPPAKPAPAAREVKSPEVLGVDLVLMALIGPPGCPVEPLIEEAAKGEMTPVVIDLALYAAMSSVQPGDHVDHARFAKLLRYAEIQRSPDRDTNAFSPPKPEEIAHWRAVALGKQ